MKQNEDGMYPKGSYVEHYDKVLDDFLKVCGLPDVHTRGTEIESRLVEIQMPKAFWTVITEWARQGEEAAQEQIDCLTRAALYKALFSGPSLGSVMSLAVMLTMKEVRGEKENA